MSASLVGSEMCIRDRISTLPCAKSAICNPPKARQCCTPPLSAIRPCKPVSYTHLTLPTICSV
eukprot:4938956-Alexandrium_andersonii.AAC.1